MSNNSNTCRFITGILILLCLCITATSCRDSRQGKKDDITIGVVLKQSTSPLFCEIEKGIRASAEKQGVKIIVLSPDGRSSQEQEQLVDRLVEKPVSAILLAPENEKSCIRSIIKAHDKGIPVILIDTGINRDLMKGREECIQSLVTCDHKKGGMLAGEYLADRLNGKGTVAFIEGIHGQSTGQMRKEGFLEALGKRPAMKVMETPPGNYQRNTAFKVFTAFYARHPEITGVFATNDLMAVGVSEAAGGLKRKSLLIVGFNATQEGLSAVKESRLDATVNQHFSKIGETAVASALRAIKGDKLPSVQLIAPELITKESLQMPFKD